MAYSTASELETRLGTTLYNELGDSDAARQAQWIADADAEINAALATRYATPINTSQSPGAVPKLRQLSLAIATYYAHAGKPPVPDAVKDRHDTAIEWLTAFEKGKVDLPVEVPIDGPTTSSRVAATYGSAPTYSRSDMEGL